MSSVSPRRSAGFLRRDEISWLCWMDEEIACQKDGVRHLVEEDWSDEQEGDGTEVQEPPGNIGPGPRHHDEEPAAEYCLDGNESHEVGTEPVAAFAPLQREAAARAGGEQAGEADEQRPASAVGTAEPDSAREEGTGSGHGGSFSCACSSIARFLTAPPFGPTMASPLVPGHPAAATPYADATPTEYVAELPMRPARRLCLCRRGA